MTIEPTNITARQVLHRAEERLEEAGITSARRNAEWLLCDALNESRIGLLTRLDEPVPSSVIERFSARLDRRLSHEPLQYILGYTEFFGLRLEVSPDVLIPRPETEQVVEAALLLLRGRQAPRVLDVGTGSGCIALAIKSRKPTAEVWGCDLSDRALAIASANAASNELDVRFFRTDALKPGFVDVAPSELDLLVSNPPYISEAELDVLPEEVKNFEPHLALFSRGDPIRFYRRLGAVGLGLIRPGGFIIFETHADFGSAAAGILEDMSYVDVDLEEDLSGRPRILCAKRSGGAVGP